MADKAQSRRTHESAAAHVAGAAVYVDDMPAVEGMLHVAIGFSQVACGVLREMDLGPVRQSAGVVDVITAADIPAKRDIGPVFPGDPLLADARVHYHGQPLFAVAATSHAAARRAVLAANIDIAPETPLLDLQAAIDTADYVRPPHRMQRGDADAALARAPHRIRGETRIGGQEHFYLEGQVARVEPGEQGALTVYSSNQNPTETQHLIAEVLGCAMHQVTVVTRRMGGGFGGKETQATSAAVLAALFARRTGQVVCCRLSRRDDMLITGKRHPFLNRYDVGFDDEGRILAAVFTLAAQCGYSPDLSDAIVDRAMFHCDNAYYLPEVTIDGLRCRSNTASNTAFRGFGGPQGMLTGETVLDHIASYLGRDPLAIRQLNFYDDVSRNITPYHQRVEGFTVPACVDQLAKAARYAERRAEVDAFNASSRILKKGLALTPVKFGISFTVTHLNQAGALLHLYRDGSVLINHGGTEMGQGLMTKVEQIVSDALGIPPTAVHSTATRTDKVPNTSATAASSGTDLNGMAALEAAMTVRRRLEAFLAERHGVSVEAMQFGERVSVRDAAGGTRHYSWHDLAEAAYLARVPLSATGFYRTPDIHYDRESASGHPFYYYAGGAALSEVVIDTLTGENRVLRVDIVHDVGRSINAAIDIGQIEGGYIQGLGWLTHEELVWNSDGRLLTDGPATYKIPAIGDTPPAFTVSLLQDSPNVAATVFRSKAVGEPPLMLAISAFSAIRDAIAAAADHRVFPELSAPATPEAVLNALHAARRV